MIAPERTALGIVMGAAPLAVIGLSTALFLFRLGDASLWMDEAWTAMVVRTDAEQFAASVRAEGGSQVLYYLLMRAWTQLGSTEAWLRLPSVLFAMSTLVVFYRLAVRLFDRQVALVAVALLGINPFFVRYAQEARGYTLAMLLSVLAMLAFVRGVQTAERRWWLIYGVLAALAVYAHLFSALVFAGHALSLAALRRDQVPWRHALLGGGVAAALLVPLAVLVVGGSGQVGEVGGRSLGHTFRVAVALAGNRGLLANVAIAAAWGAGLLSTIALVRRARRGDETWRWTVVAVSGLFPVAVTWLYSLANPVLADRYMLTTLPWLSLLAALGAVKLAGSNRIALTVGVALVAVLSVARTIDDAGRLKFLEDWRGVTELVLADARSGDVLVFYEPWYSIAFQYYAIRADGDHSHLRFHVPGEGLVSIEEIPSGSAADDVPTLSRGMFRKPPPRLVFGWIRAYRDDDLSEFRTLGTRVWVVVRGRHPHVSVDDVLGAVSDQQEPAVEHRIEVIDILRFNSG